MAPKRPSLFILAKYLPFWSISCHARPKNNANWVHKWFFDMWALELLFPPQKFRNFGPKTAKFGLKYAFWPFWPY